MNKNGFTFAELMISLVVIAVITAILYPTISELAPNNNKHLFKSAYKTIEMVVSDITANGAVPTTAAELCAKFKSKLNYVPRADKAGDASETSDNSCAADNQFQTSNGMRWKFENGVIYVDVNASNNKTASACTDDAQGVKPDTTGWDNGSFCGTAVVQDTFKIEIFNTGRVSVYSPIGRDHLSGETED